MLLGPIMAGWIFLGPLETVVTTATAEGNV